MLDFIYSEICSLFLHQACVFFICLYISSPSITDLPLRCPGAKAHDADAATHRLHAYLCNGASCDIPNRWETCLRLPCDLNSTSRRTLLISKSTFHCSKLCQKPQAAFKAAQNTAQTWHLGHFPPFKPTTAQLACFLNLL